MRKYAFYIFACLFWMLAIIDAAGIFTGSTFAHSFAKPLLMAAFLLFFVTSRPKKLMLKA